MSDTKPLEASFVRTNEKLYEQVIDQGEINSSVFVEHDVFSGEDRIVSKAIVGDTEYIPPVNDLVRSGVIFLPTFPMTYGTEIELIAEIQAFIYRYVDVSQTFLKIASYYVLLTWVYDNFETIPYLRLLGDFGTGKTRFQKVVGSICYKAMFTGGATTTSPIFRIIDLYKGTLILDEGDLRLSDATVEVVKILNCGYSTGTSVLRTEGDKKRVVTSYSTFGPKIIGTRKRWEDKALESRCLTEVMRGNPRKDIPIHLPKEFEKQALELRNKLLMFRFQHWGTVEIDVSLVIPHIEARINQIALALLSLVKDEDARKEITEFVTGYAHELKNSRGQELPAEILQVMQEMALKGEPLMTKKIAEKANEKRDVSMGERAISPAYIGRINSSDFNFKTRKINGVTEMLWDSAVAENLLSRYGIDPAEVVEVVDLLQGTTTGGA